jgi:xanthine phosphoribosyltransferase
MYDYNCKELQNDIKLLAEKSHLFQADTILAIARGGLIPSQLLAYHLNIRDIQTIQIQSYDKTLQRDELKLIDTTDLSNCSRVLIVDDIVDSGNTLNALLLHVRDKYPHTEFKSASLFYKPSASVQPDFTCKEAKEWINFFWESVE